MDKLTLLTISDETLTGKSTQTPLGERRHSDIEFIKPSKPRRASSPGPGAGAAAGGPPRSAYIKGADTPKTTWKVNFSLTDDDSRPITALAAGPKLGQVFVGFKDGVVLLDQGKTLIKYSSSSQSSAQSMASDRSPRPKSVSRLSPTPRSALESVPPSPFIVASSPKIAASSPNISSPGLEPPPLEPSLSLSSLDTPFSVQFPFPEADSQANSQTISQTISQTASQTASQTTSQTASQTISQGTPAVNTHGTALDLGTPSTPLDRLDRGSERGRRNIDAILRLSEKDFVGTIYYVSDAPARRSTSSPIPAFPERGWVLAHWTLWKVVQWEIGSPKPRRVYPACTTTCIRPPYLWGACDDSSVREWDVRTGQCLRQLYVGEMPTQICVSSKNRFLFLSRAKTVDRWNLATNVKEAELIVDPPAFKTHGKAPTLFIDDIVMDEYGDSLYGKSPRHGIFAWDVYSKGGRVSLKWPVLLTGGGDECINWLYVRSNRVWIAGTRQGACFLEEFDPISREKLRGWRLESLPMGMAIRPDATEVYTGGLDGRVQVWDTEEKVQVKSKGRVFRDIYG